MTWKILQGDNRDTLKTLADNSIDAIVTDPPYGIDFLGKDWDANTGALETYQECLRVLKPGGHLLAFSAARTYHHLAITLEQAGFEIRDQIIWLQSNGFPKSITHLKPQHEPICMAKKKGKTYLNITDTQVNGRYPSNVIGDVEKPYQKYFYSPKVSRKERHIGYEMPPALFGDKQGAFDDNGKRYAVELDRREGNVGNNHPTVKPIELMKYLIKLITPKGGTVLDPFNGSGSTGCAAVELGYDYIGCELDPKYVEISEKRIEAWFKTADPIRASGLFEVEE
jgi:site-specific DNA-methyltransferase (adenine-specific)